MMPRYWLAAWAVCGSALALAEVRTTLVATLVTDRRQTTSVGPAFSSESVYQTVQATTSTLPMNAFQAAMCNMDDPLNQPHTSICASLFTTLQVTQTLTTTILSAPASSVYDVDVATRTTTVEQVYTTDVPASSALPSLAPSTSLASRTTEAPSSSTTPLVQKGVLDTDILTVTSTAHASP
jgi:hypothetical protein